MSFVMLVLEFFMNSSCFKELFASYPIK